MHQFVCQQSSNVLIIILESILLSGILLILNLLLVQIHHQIEVKAMIFIVNITVCGSFTTLTHVLSHQDYFMRCSMWTM